MAFASWADQRPWHGWVLGYDAQTLKQVVVFNASPNGWGAGIWQAGAAPTADSDGNPYLVTGNGAFNADTGGTDFGDSILKLQPQGGSLSVVDYFTPYNQEALSQVDLEIGSGGPLLVESGSAAHPHLLIGAGKAGTVYVVDRNKMGHFHAGDDSQIVMTRGMCRKSSTTALRPGRGTPGASRSGSVCPPLPTAGSTWAPRVSWMFTVCCLGERESERIGSGDVLGHRSANSANTYLKLASEDLRAVALEIPVEVNA